MIGRRAHHRAAFRDGLTERQLEVLALVARGRTNSEIASELGIAFETVKKHVSEILGRLGVESREEAAAAWRASAGRTRISRSFEGALLFAATKGVVLAATAIVVAALGTGAILFLARDNNGGDTPADINSSTATATPTTGFADFGPTLTPEELSKLPGYNPTPLPTPTILPKLTTIGGATVRQLTVGAPSDLPQNTTLYFNATCYACHGGINMHRAYRDAAGELHIDSIMPTLPANPPDGPVQRVTDWTSEGAGLVFALVCTGDCGAFSDPTPGSKVDLHRSRDGGISWQVVAVDLPMYSYLVGAGGGEVIVATSAGTGPWKYAWYPEGRELRPPPGVPADAKPSLTPTHGLTWSLSTVLRRERHSRSIRTAVR